MKEFNDLWELAKYFDVTSSTVKRSYYEQSWRGSFTIKDVDVRPCVCDGLIKYVLVDENNNDDCKDFIMKYEINKYDWKVYVDDLEGWQDCEVLNVDNKGLNIVRATVRTKFDTVVNRVVEYAETKKDIKPNRCVFMVEKEYEGYNENDFYNTKNKILLAENNSGGYFLSYRTNRVEHISYKGSGGGNCIMGDLDYMKALVKKQLKNSSCNYKFTEEGKKFLEVN